MPITKAITTPAGNVLGSYGVVTQVAIMYSQANPVLLAVGCVLTLWADAQSFTDGKPAVAVYRYPVNAILQPTDDPLAAAESALLQVPDRGNFVTADATQQQIPNQNPWTPGWIKGDVVSPAPAPTPIITPTPLQKQRP